MTGSAKYLNFLFWANVFFYLAFALLSFFPAFDERFFRIAYSGVLVILLFPLSGINLAFLVERFFGQSFSFWERLSLASTLALLIQPLLLSLEYTFLGWLDRTLPILNSALFFLPIVFFALRERSTLLLKETWFPLRQWVFWVAFGTYFSLAFFMTTSYYPLPDIDPYGWMENYTAQFGEGSIATLNGYRPLFSSLVYILNQSALIDMYALFKYALPFLWLWLLPAAALLASTYRGFWSQLSVFFAPFVNASVILYLHTPIPQALLSTLLFTYAYFLAYAVVRNQNFFYFFSGIIILLGYLYHETSAIFIVIWIATTLFFYWRTLIFLVFRNKVASLLGILLLLSYSQTLFFPIGAFLINGISQVQHALLSWEHNFLYPSSYVNIDGISVGWGDWIGVTKYYAFYAGPTALLCLVAIGLGWFLLRERQRFSHAGHFVLLFSFLIFFIIAEIFPRFLNLSMLPERAWGLAAPFLVILGVLSLRDWQERKWTYPFLIFFFFLTVVINIGGALYINSLKQYIITEGQLASTEWIQSHLPKDRLIFTFSGSKNVILTHSQSSTESVKDPEFYSNIVIFEKYLDDYYRSKIGFEQLLPPALESLANKLADIQQARLPDNVITVLEDIGTISKEAAQLRENIELTLAEKPRPDGRPIYIYYARIHPKNPYGERPYFNRPEDTAKESFIFDQYPDRFARVYSLDNDEVVIWYMQPSP